MKPADDLIADYKDLVRRGSGLHIPVALPIMALAYLPRFQHR